MYIYLDIANSDLLWQFLLKLLIKTFFRAHAISHRLPPTTFGFYEALDPAGFGRGVVANEVFSLALLQEKGERLVMRLLRMYLGGKEE